MSNFRDILIFPEFKNIEKIEEIRKKYDKLYKIIKPHITIVFPFQDEIDDYLLVNELREILKKYKKFKVVFKGVTLSHDNYIYLNCVEGEDILIKLHDEIYSNILPQHLKKEIKYIPHITLGQSDNIDFLKDFNFIFETYIEEICLEKIGENDESIILKKINF